MVTDIALFSPPVKTVEEAISPWELVIIRIVHYAIIKYTSWFLKTG